MSVGALAFGIYGAIEFFRAVTAGDRLLQPLRAKYGGLTDYEWYSNDEGRSVFHGPGPTGEDSWLIYYAAWMISFVIGFTVLGGIGLSMNASAHLRSWAGAAVVVVVGALGWMWVRYRETIEIISAIVE